MQKRGQNRSFSLYNFSSKNRKGLSTVVITLIIILISLVAVGIIWVVVRNVIQTGTKEVTLGQFTLDAKIKDVNVYNFSNNVSLTIKRNPGVGEFSRMNFVFYDGKNSEVVTQPVSLNELEEKWFMFHLGTIDVDNLISISIFPYVKQDEKEILGNILDKYTVSGKNSIIIPTNCTPLVNNYCSVQGYECGYWGNNSCSGNLSCGTCGTGNCVSGNCVSTNCNTSSLTWQNNPITTQNGWFTAIFNATPYNNSRDGVFGLSQQPGTAYANFSALLRFNQTGYIEAYDRNVLVYRSLQLVPYTANTKYSFRFIVNLTSQNYSVYVTPQGGSQVLLASDYAFRTLATTINNWGIIGSSLTFDLCDFAITSSIPGPSSVLCEPNTYYIDFVSGSDSNNGTCSDSAWKHAPGDTNAVGIPAGVMIQPGNKIIFKGGITYDGTIEINRTRYQSGTYTNRIILRSGDRNTPAWGTGRAVIDGKNIRGKGFRGLGVMNFITIDGFEIMNMSNATDSAGIFVEWGASSDWVISNNLIHHVYGQAGSSGYGIETSGLNKNFIIEFNEVYFVEEKAIELYATSNTTVRYNYLHQTRDHNMVVSGANNSIYGNLLTQAGYNWAGVAGMRPAYSFKVDSGNTPGYDYADYNNIYNNIIWDTTTAMGILNGRYNNFSNNVVYYVGFDDLKDVSGGNEGFTLLNDGTSTNNVTGNKITNNIFYYITLWSTGNGPIYPVGFSFRNQTSVTNNEVKNNLFYYNSSQIDFVRFSPSGTGYPYTYHNLSWFQGPSGFAKVGTGNIASGNIVADPNFAGGGVYFNWLMIPTWFDSQGHPNQIGFKLTVSSPARDTGLALSPPFNIDADGISRPQGSAWDIGAYEYV